MALRKIPIRRVMHRDNLFLGGDRELVLFCGAVAFALVFTAQELRAGVVGVSLWFLLLYFLRLMAKADPKLRYVYLRQLIYKPYYPARSTSWRVNTTRQGNQYT
ncbi:MAG TPA: conjugal transfer protein TrbD [Nitrospira sp.]|nr:conjugal transfer protein TrbD [Nitrospira sp.]